MLRAPCWRNCPVAVLAYCSRRRVGVLLPSPCWGIAPRAVLVNCSKRRVGGKSARRDGVIVCCHVPMGSSICLVVLFCLIVGGGRVTRCRCFTRSVSHWVVIAATRGVIDELGLMVGRLLSQLRQLTERAGDSSPNRLETMHLLRSAKRSREKGSQQEGLASPQRETKLRTI